MHTDGTPRNLTTTSTREEKNTKERHRESGNEKDENLLDSVTVLQNLQNICYFKKTDIVIYYHHTTWRLTTHNFSVQYDRLLQFFSACAIWTNLPT